MTGRADIDRGIGHGDQVRGPQYVFPGFQEEGGVVELARVVTVDKSNIVLFHRHSQELGNTGTFRVDYLLSQVEAQHVHEYIVHSGQVGAIEQAVVKADRKSTRLNSSHVRISYAVFC